MIGASSLIFFDSQKHCIIEITLRAGLLLDVWDSVSTSFLNTSSLTVSVNAGHADVCLYLALPLNNSVPHCEHTYTPFECIEKDGKNNHLFKLFFQKRKSVF